MPSFYSCCSSLLFFLFICLFCFFRYFIQNPDTIFRSNRLEVLCRKSVLRNFAKLTGKHLCQSLFFNKVAGQACNFIKKQTLTQVFSREFCEISNNTSFTKHLWWLRRFFIPKCVLLNFEKGQHLFIRHVLTYAIAKN